MTFEPWNSFNSTLFTIREKQFERKEKAKRDQQYRTLRADILQLLSDSTPRINDMKQWQRQVTYMADELVKLFKESQTWPTYYANYSATPGTAPTATTTDQTPTLLVTDVRLYTYELEW